MSDDRVTLRDIYAVVNRLEDKTNQRLDKLESDVENIKTFQNRVAGVSGILSAFVALAASWIWNKITGEV